MCHSELPQSRSLGKGLYEGGVFVEWSHEAGGRWWEIEEMTVKGALVSRLVLWAMSLSPAGNLLRNRRESAPDRFSIVPPPSPCTSGLSACKSPGISTSFGECSEAENERAALGVTHGSHGGLPLSSP